MDILDEFIEWYFSMFETDTITCPHCNAEIEKEQLQGDGESIVCAHCNGKITKNDFSL